LTVVASRLSGPPTRSHEICTTTSVGSMYVCRVDVCLCSHHTVRALTNFPFQLSCTLLPYLHDG
jgi:hypothetical protein